MTTKTIKSRELATLLGRTQGTINNWVRKGKIAALRVGSTNEIIVKSVIQFLGETVAKEYGLTDADTPAK